jgi:CheY-like chemotaxis protein
MDAVGQLTGGVAHDFNNMLTTILLNADVLATEIENDRLRQLAEGMRRVAEHGAELTSRLLAFGRRQTLMPRPTDINELLSDMVPLMQRTLGEHIEIKLTRGADLWPATVDRGQLENAVLNLAVNARDAMPSSGRLTIETANAELDEDYAARNPDVRTGRYVMIAVADTGSGMAPDVLEHVFEPFYTTKGVGKGTGLGLSMVYGFIRQSGGHIKVYSEVGYGTTFKLYLPLATGPASNAAARPSAPRQPATARRVGNQTILAVEDNPDLRATVARQLRDLGYRVCEAESASDALAVLGDAERVDLLFTDMMLPGGVNGKELATEARAKRPDLKVLFTSGFPGTSGRQETLLEPGDVLLSKPYHKHDLTKAIEAALSTPG